MKKKKIITKNTKYNKSIIYTAFALTMFIIMPEIKAKEVKEVKIEIETSLVSSYVWRGLYQTGVSLQPSISTSISNLTLKAWGNTDFSTAFKEFDFSLFYANKGLCFGLTDYWWSGQGAPYFEYKTHHLLEASIGYHFGDKFPLSFSWNTMLAGNQDKNNEDKQLYSSYFTIGYDFLVKGVKCTSEVGINPWKSIYNAKFDVMNISLKASRKVPITDEFSLPLSAQMILCPATSDAHLVFGITF